VTGLDFDGPPALPRLLDETGSEEIDVQVHALLAALSACEIWERFARKQPAPIPASEAASGTTLAQLPEAIAERHVDAKHAFNS